MNKQTAKPVPEVQFDIPFPDETYYIQLEWVTKVDVPDIPKETFYYVVRNQYGFKVGIYGYHQPAFIKAQRLDVTLLWAH